VIAAVLIVAALAAVVYVLTSAPPTQPPTIGLDYVTVAAQGGRTSADQGELLTLTATAFDTEGTDVTTSATSFTWSASPSNAVDIRASAVPYTVRIFGLMGQAVTITANATHNSTSKQASLQLTITPVHFELAGSVVVAEVGTPFILTVRVLRADSSAAAGYRGTVHFTSNDTSATLPPDYTYIAGDLGSHDSSVNLSRAGIVGITAQDTLASITGILNIRGNHVPVAGMTATASPADPQEVTVDGTSSSDADGDALTYSWDFGDSTPRDTTPTSTHRYSTAGTYEITLTVADIHGASDSVNRTFQAKVRPTAIFTVRPMTPFGSDINATVDASGSTDDGALVSYDWDWGDTQTSTVTTAVTTHTYAASYDGQTVTMTLTVTDNDGLTNTISQVVLVTLQQLPPVANFTFSVDPNTRTVSVDATPPISSDPNGNIAYYNWTWGDGSYLNSTSPTATHQYPSNNAYTLNLTVVDTTNLQGWKEQTVTINQPALPPTARFNVTRTLMHVDLDASASSDPNGDITTYSWDTNNDGTPDASGVTATFDYASPGTYTIKLTVTDATARTSTATKKVSVGTSTIDYSYFDFFNVPYGEWWDYRFATYGDLPINADCFNATSITDGICVPSNAAIPDSETYPYTNWYPLPGNLKWDNPSNNPMVYAPYRLHVTGMTVPGYNRSEPVFLPVLNYAQPAGNRLDFDWRMNYLDKATGDYLTNVVGCPSVDPAAYDGFYIRSQITLAMDLQESKRIFNVVGTDQSSAQSWWNTNTNSACGLMGPAETNVKNWFLAMGGGGSGSAGVGKYDIANSFEWYYTNWYLQMTATVDADGTTHVSIDHAAWGTEVMLSRMFYWGNTSYKLNYLDSSKATGWWGMELAWFEDFSFAGSLGAPGGGFNFNLTSAMQYHFQHQSSPGPNGLYDRTDDVPFWTWGPILTDYTNDYFPLHPGSELDRYPSPYYGYIHSTPGGRPYGVNNSYDYAPIRWNLAAGQTWHFQFPAGNVVFYDPNLTPVPANPQGGFILISSPMKYFGATPAGYGDWDATNLTWDVYGPAVTGGPLGTPGPDGVPGTSDDQYALWPYGAIQFNDPPVGMNLRVATSSESGGVSTSASLGPTWVALVGSGRETTIRRFRA